MTTRPRAPSSPRTRSTSPPWNPSPPATPRPTTARPRRSRNVTGQGQSGNRPNTPGAPARRASLRAAGTPKNAVQVPPALRLLHVLRPPIHVQIRPRPVEPHVVVL